MNTQRLSIPFPIPLSSCFINVGRTRTKSKRYRSYEKTVAIVLAGSRQMKPPYHIDIAFCAPDRRKRDADNLFKCLFDTLVKNGILEDDNNQCIHSATWCWVYEADPCVISITSI